MVTVKLAECHDTCLEVTGPDDHVANVNPVAFTTNWRVDCDGCFTCVAIRNTKAEALLAARAHVVKSVGVGRE